jgi:hypothetical protein
LLRTSELKTGGLLQFFCSMGPLPGKPRFLSAEMAITGRPLIDRLEKVEILDDRLGPHVEMFTDDLGNLVRRYL